MTQLCSAAVQLQLASKVLLRRARGLVCANLQSWHARLSNQRTGLQMRRLHLGH